MSMYHLARNITSRTANALALAGGFVMALVIIANVISIIGRAFVPLDIGIGPVRGIYDMTEIGMAAALFAFLPLAQFNDAHARVDLFTAFMSRNINAALEFIFNIAMLGVAAIGTQRLYLGCLDKFTYGETTLIAQIPVWYGYAAGLIGATGFVLVSGFCVWRSALRLLKPDFKDVSA